MRLVRSIEVTGIPAARETVISGAPGLLAVGAAGSFANGNSFQARFPVPLAPVLRGLVVRWQGAVTDNGAVALSNPATYVRDEH